MIKDNLERIRDRVEAACRRSGRSSGEVRIVAVAKNRTVQEIQAVIFAGITDIAENRMQEALLHNRELSERGDGLRATGQGRGTMTRHFIGHLQTNKAKDAVELFDLIHSVDSVRLAQELAVHAKRLGKVQDILLQVNTSGEKQKFGVTAGEAEGMLAEIAQLRHVRTQGLMTIAPIVDDPGQAKMFFRVLRQLRDDVCGRRADCGLSILSMGMSDDFEAAVEEGATMIRIGRAIFEEA